MSVAAGRWLLAVSAVATTISLSWFCVILSAIDFEIRRLPGLGFATGTIALTAGAVFFITLALTTRFVEASVAVTASVDVASTTVNLAASRPRNAPKAVRVPSLLLRRVLRRTQSIPLHVFEDIVVMQYFILPGRLGGSSVARVVGRKTDGSVISFTPLGFGLPEALHRHGVTVTIDS